MNTVHIGTLNDTFEKVKNCITASTSNEIRSVSGPIAQICNDLFIPIQNLYYHITCLTENTSLFPQSVSEHCKGYLQKLSNHTTTESIFNIYGSKLQNYIIESGKYTAPCEIVEDCDGINDEISLSTKSDFPYQEICFWIMYALLMLAGIHAVVKICKGDYDSDSDSANYIAEYNHNNKNIELITDDLHNTQNLPNNYDAGNKYETIVEVELAGDAEAVSV